MLTIDSGDQVTIEPLSGGPANLPGQGFQCPAGTATGAREKPVAARPGHILTGPVGGAARNPATCWRSASSMSNCARTGATPSSARWPGALPGEFDAASRSIAAWTAE